jgi:hypothetical protein
VVAAISSGDAAALASLRRQITEFTTEFDRLAAIVQNVGQRDAAAATRALAGMETPRWRVPASIFCALAAAASGDIRGGLALANRVASDVDSRIVDEAADFTKVGPELIAQRAIIGAGLSCLAELEKTCARPATRPPIPPPFSYLISYPRSGNTMLRLFLSFAFEAPMYSVYPGDGRYFSRYFHATADDRAVFVKDHEWHDEYADEDVLAIVRDGRDVIVSYARYLYAEGHHSYVGAGELSDFLRFVTERGIGFWGDHVQTVLAARERGARIRIVRYEDLFRNYAGLSALARDLAGRGRVPREDEEGWYAHMARLSGLPATPGWSENLDLPEGSFVPSSWSVGGGTIDWRRAFDAPARRHFHELGGSEALLKLGYESDPAWWRTN